MASSPAITNNRLIKLAIKYLPLRTKRLTLLASLAGVFKVEDEIDDQIVHSINEVMNLAYDDDALRLPLHVSDLIWTNMAPYTREVRALKAQKQIGDVLYTSAVKIVESVPDWFIYDNRETVVKDVLCLFRVPSFQRQKQLLVSDHAMHA